MRQVLAVVVLVVAVACAETARVDRGDGTSIVTSGSLKGLVCTNPDCSGITDLIVAETDLYFVNLAGLTSAGSLEINGNAALAHVSLPALTSVDSLSITSNLALVTVSASALTSSLNLRFDENTALTSVSLPSLTTVEGLVSVAHNPVLTSLSLPALTTVGNNLFIYHNTSYPQCAALAILKQLATAPTYVGISDNNTTATCPPVICDGDVTITTSAEMDAFVARGCTSVGGTLTISGSDLTSVSLPSLRTANSLEIKDNIALVAVNLPALATVTSNRTFRCYGGGVGGLGITGNTALAVLGLPALASIGAGEISGNPALGIVDVPALAAIHEPSGQGSFCVTGGLRIGGQSLFSIFLPALVTGDLDVTGSGVTTLSLPALTNGSVGVSWNPALTSLSLPALTTVSGYLVIVGNTGYPQCAAEAILAQLSTPPGYVDISGNDTTATCPP